MAASSHVLDAFENQKCLPIFASSSTMYIHIQIRYHPPLPNFYLQQRHIPTTLVFHPNNPSNTLWDPNPPHSSHPHSLSPIPRVSTLLNISTLFLSFIPMATPIPVTPLFSPITLPLDPHSLTPETDATTLSVDTHFGFDPLTKTHKVLRPKWTVAIPEPYPRVIQMVCTVLTLGCSSNGSWRKVKINPELPFPSVKYMSVGKSVCIDGVIHWLPQYGNSIVAFDLKDEKFRLIPRPHDYKAENFILPLNRLIELGGCLALVADKYKYAKRDDSILQLWILKDYHNRVWFKEKFCIPFYWGDCQPFPIGTIPSGEIILKALKITCWVIFYDMEGQGFKVVDITGLPEWVYSSCTGINTTVSVYEG
ncbi:hypothetical protein CMV_019621 [Castanea mollissima]|uniref:F-box associated beta-propeller type 3 domain-containing protein n=1 Tax=Castanea mollissima TaxID=60419 RepID=A0A8J4QXW5_9ROSI|nr:hypothetical protein CMV_019621 [Castanea mollissima]